MVHYWRGIFFFSSKAPNYWPRFGRLKFNSIIRNNWLWEKNVNTRKAIPFLLVMRWLVRNSKKLFCGLERLSERERENQTILLAMITLESVAGAVKQIEIREIEADFCCHHAIKEVLTNFLWKLFFPINSPSSSMLERKEKPEKFSAIRENSFHSKSRLIAHHNAS